MSIDLNDFAATLAIGGGAIFLSLMILRVFFGITVRTSLQKSDIGGMTQGIFLLVSAFGVGVLLEDLSNSYADVDEYFFQDKLAFPHEKDIRSEALLGFDDAHRCGPHYLPEVSSFAEEYIAAGLLPARATVATQGHAGHCEWIQRVDELASGPLYYNAKNLVYREDNYFNELSKIQSRIDLSRSVSITSVIFMLIVALSMILTAAIYLTGRKFPADRTALLIRLRITGILLGCLFAAHLAGRFAYAAEEREFDLRVFGYYQSLAGAEAAKNASVEEALPVPVAQASQQL